MIPVLGFILLAQTSRAQLDATFSYIAPSCATASDGQLCCETITGGVPPYSCAIVPSVGTYNPVTDCFENMPSGLFNITITDSQNNTGSAIGYVGPSNVPGVTIDETIIPAACGGNTGSICCEVSGGSGSFTYIWYQDAGPVLLGSGTVTAGQTICINSLSAGDYTLILDDNNTICGEIFSFIVTESTLSASATINPATCDTPCNGTILVELSQATLPVSISWSGTASGSVSGITSTDYLISGLCPGTYQITVDDASSCSPVVLSGQNVGLDNSDIFISGCNNLVWNPDYFFGQTDVTLSGNLIIEQGACLVIEDMTIRMKTGTSIRIEESGELTCINSVFDVGCEDITWQGFSVLGSQLTACDHEIQRGILNLDHCTITHAEIGAANYDLGGDNYGGKITAVGSTWLNNIRDLRLANYTPSISGSSTDYACYFDACQFLLTATQAYTIHHYRIHLVSISDVRFHACDIINTVPALYTTNGYGAYGIYAASSHFQWIGDNESEISGVARGIWSTGTFMNPECSDGIFTTTDVTQTTFRCSNAVYFNLVNTCNVIGNSILPLPVGFTTTSYRAIQVQAPGTSVQSTYLVADNIINYTGTNIGRVGITIDNCKGQTSHVFRNTIYNGGPGIKFLNRNRANTVGTGISGSHFECNIFHNCSTDIQVTCAGSGCSQANTGVAGWQTNTFGNLAGPWSYSALNNFTDSHPDNVERDDIDAGVDQAIGTMNGFKYRYRSADFNADNYDNGPDEPTECSLISDPAPFNIVTAEIQILQNPSEYCDLQQISTPSLPEIEANFEITNSTYQEYYQIYQSLVDGGNTEFLKNNVLYSEYTQALELYETLIEASPALSEEVMIAAIQKEYELPSSMLTMILAANPSAAKNPEIWKAINERSAPLDPYQKAQIMLGYFNTSPKEIMEEEMGCYLASIDQTIKHAIKWVSENNNSSNIEMLRTMVHEVGTYEYDFMLAELEMQNFDFDEGVLAMENLTQKYKLSPQLEESLNTLILLRKIQHDAVNRPGHELSQSEIDFLTDIRDHDGCDLGELAQSILMTFDEFEEIELECMQLRNLRSESVRREKISTCSVYPNPSNTGWLIFKTTSPINLPIEIKLLDSSARVVFETETEPHQQELLIDVTHLSSGIYLLKTNLEEITPIKITIQ